MFFYVCVGLMLLAIVLPPGIFFLGEAKGVFSGNRDKYKPSVKRGRFKKSLLINISTFFGLLIVATLFLFRENAAAANGAAGLTDQSFRFLAASISTGLATVGAGIATGAAASSALGAISENEKIMGKSLIFVALAEGIAIYGLLISFMILNT